MSNTNLYTDVDWTFMSEAYDICDIILAGQFDEGAWRNFDILYLNEVIDEKRGTTLRRELSSVYALIAGARGLRIVEDANRNYYHTQKAYRDAEKDADMDGETKSAISRNEYMKAGRKICFLNAMCIKLTGRSFLTEKFDRDSAVQMAGLAEAFIDSTKA